MRHELCRLTGAHAVELLKKREISPLDLIEASGRRIAEVEPAVMLCQPCAWIKGVITPKT
ncbi:hypothetical protein IVB14_24910 [Bradyrhizobium sp. 180]|uniref:hypothetical protein n=1 Tax=Bradyrhizobium sp. 180 TaxID=2782650 RepID=UPI001FF8610B|nr:hypothetical protein [Bradyrhizobium sp. 180]MCK1493559.1 hypothetical protein [Bradyrhizobium sp. 180]